MDGSFDVAEIRDPGGFMVEVGPLLLRDEARHNLLLGIADTLMRQPRVYPRFHLWTVSERGTTVACAAMTPPFNLVVSQPSREGAISALGHGLVEGGIAPPGVTGAVPEADEFASSWHGVTGDAVAVKSRQKIYEARAIQEPRDVPGRMREGVPSDLELVVAWMHGFYDETPTERPGREDQIEGLVELRLRKENGGFYLWEDPEPVSLAGYAGFTPNGARIGPVYTPPERRRRGYASALTAGVSRRLLDSGRRLCFLYTDAANPTSNRIYQAIGYEPVCDSVEYRFTRRHDDAPPCD